MNSDQAILGSQEWWDEYFAPGGGWERNGGRQQTRQFARAFLRWVRLEEERPFTLLDVGCALGDALCLIHKRYPQARLFGIDHSETAVARCRAEAGEIAIFARQNLEEIDSFYDVIYISALLEHFFDYAEKARFLARHCRRLIIIVPYDEFGGPPPAADLSRHHQANFREESFDFLLAEGLAEQIESHRVFCRGAWSLTWRRRIGELYVKNPLRRLLGKKLVRDRQMIIFDVRTRSGSAPGERRVEGDQVG